MKLYRILALAIPLALSSCLNDRTTEATNPISEITIVEGSIKSQYDIKRDSTLVIAPEIEQSNVQKPLTYSWEVDGQVYSQDATLTYTGKSYGSYACRLVVANEDGKAFFPFTLNVNTIYEEGITIISKTPEGKSRLSFMLTNPDGTDSGVFYDYDCFSKVNSEENFASNVSDMRQCSGNLIIACQGSDSETDCATIYYLNEKTLIVENMLSIPEYSDFKPTKMQMPSTGAEGTTYPILCENGKVYEFSETEGTLIPGVKFQSTYSQSCVSYEKGQNYNLIFWDEDANDLCQISNGYGPYYCSTTYNLEQNEVNNESNYFNGYTFVAMFIPRQTRAQQAIDAGEIVVIVKKSGIHYAVRLHANFWVYNSENATTILSDGEGFGSTGIGVKLTTQSPCVANQTYNTLLFSDGKTNNVYRWNYTNITPLANAKSIAAVGSDKAVITGMEISNDHKRTYVAYYEPDEAGLNGHVTVLDTNTGDNLAQYDNVCYRPVKIMYKKK